MHGHAAYVGVGAGRRYVIEHRPPPGLPLRAVVLHAPPWAEEMNKSRRMVAMQSRALAAAGMLVHRPDLLGCGDSPGELADAGWARWIDDLVQAAAALQARHAGLPLWLWGLRSGALLASAAARRLSGDVRLLYWQPATSGKPVLQQFLRLHSVAAALLPRGGPGAKPEQLIAELESGSSVEVAGYVLPPAVALGLRGATLEPPPAAAPVAWFELSTQPEATLLPASQAVLARWREAGHAVRAEVVPGPSFWQTQEIEDAPSLIAATTAALSEDRPPRP